MLRCCACYASNVNTSSVRKWKFKWHGKRWNAMQWTRVFCYIVKSVERMMFSFSPFSRRFTWLLRLASFGHNRWSGSWKIYNWSKSQFKQKGCIEVNFQFKVQGWSKVSFLIFILILKFIICWDAYERHVWRSPWVIGLKRSNMWLNNEKIG